jgi:hypothetical protein
LRAKGTGLFASFWLGGFESAIQRNRYGRRIDMIAATQHDVQAAADYALLRSVGMAAARDGVRWPLIEQDGRFDFASLAPMAAAAREQGVQVSWNLCHYGWPDDVDVFAPTFPDRFARFCGEVARFLASESDAVPLYTPINEISYLAWAAGDQGKIHPRAHGRGGALKRQLVRATIAAAEAIWAIDPRARILTVDPLIHVVGPRRQPRLPAALAYDEIQFEAWDMLSGRLAPELGGHPRYLDVMGVNFYFDNQWEFPNRRLRWEDDPRDDRWVPLHQLLARAHARYQRPIFISETSHIGEGRAAWMREIASELEQALAIGVPLEGACIYPVLDRPDWDHPRQWHHSGLWELVPDPDGTLRRVLVEEYAAELTRAQARLGDAAATTGTTEAATTEGTHDSARGYPRPQLRRAKWWSLDGAWEFAIDTDARWTRPDQVAWEGKIEVPFAPETPASGVGDTGLYEACWYRRVIAVPALAAGERLIVRFGAVDYEATVWLNGQAVAHHEGGYTPFGADVTRALSPGGPQVLVVRAKDDPQDLTKPRGKQDWQAQPHSIWYHRTTGIWQSVWMEVLPASAISTLRWTSSLERWQIGLEASFDGAQRHDLRLGVKLRVGDDLLADDTYTVVGGEVRREIALSDPGIDDHRNDLLWTPSRPTLVQAELRLWGRRGELIDEVTSYTALRSIAIGGDRIELNGRPIHLRMVLDQGYWPESGLTAPDDAALRRDVELAKAMGFNGVRKHQKIEDPRYLYWADVLGLLVWEEMPSAYRFTTRSVERLSRQWTEAILRDMSHPCIVAWVPFNESWGVPDLPTMAEQRHYVQALYHLTKTIDDDRPVVGNDGWESSATDIVGIHDYDADVARLARRYSSDEALSHVFRRERPAGRLLTLAGHPHAGQPIMLTEFGGIALSRDPDATWGYSRSANAADFAERYRRLMTVVNEAAMFAGFCYTQFADTYQESNGLLYADRTPKIPLEEIAAATRGPER